MAASNSSRSRGARIPHEFPAIEIPEDADVSEYRVSFSLKTAGGDVGVTLDRDFVRCFGTPDALVAAGIVLRDWIPVGRRSQCVAFTESGLQVRIGGRGRPKGLYMHVSDYLCEAGKYQAGWRLPRNSRLMAEADRLLLREKREKEIRSAKKLVASWHKSSGDFRESASNSADIFLGMLEGKLFDGESGGWRYNDATTHKIERLTDQIMELIKTGAIVEDIALKEKHTPACFAEEVLESDAAYAESPIQYGGNVVPFRKPCHLGPKPL